MKLAIIGAGSSYTPEIIDGLLKETCFDALELALYDLPEAAKRVETICGLAQRMAQKRGAKMRFYQAENVEQALSGCDFVVSQFRAGLLEARVWDERTPLKFGLLGQETTGAGGFFNAMRTIPQALELAHTMERLCPRAWLINFTNPSGIITQAVQQHTKVRCVGLCNVPYNMHMDAAKLLQAEPERVFCSMAGLNHLSFVTEVYLDGTPMLQKMIKQKLFTTQVVKNIPKVEGADSLIEMLGVVPSPYLQYFYFEKEMLQKQMAEAADGGPGTRGEQIIQAQEALFSLYAQPGLCEKPKELAMRGGAYYSTVATMLMKALAGQGSVTMPVNCANQGAINDISAQSVVETNCLVDATGVHPLCFGALPTQLAGLVQQVKCYENLTVEAAVEHSRSKALQALLSHPLVHGYQNAVALLDELQHSYAHFVGVLN